MGKMLGFFILIGIVLVALGLYFEGGQGGIATTLTSSLSATGTTATVADTDGFVSSGSIIIGNEVIKYTGKTATTFTGLTRGAADTIAAAYASGKRVYDPTLGYANMATQYQTAVVQNEVENASRITLNPIAWGAMVLKFTLAPPFLTGTWRLVLLPWYAFTACLLFSLALAMAGLIRTVFLRS